MSEVSYHGGFDIHSLVLENIIFEDVAENASSLSLTPEWIDAAPHL